MAMYRIILLLVILPSTLYTAGGLRFNYNDLNNEFLLSPRVGASWKPDWKNDIIFKAAARRLSSASILQGIASL